MGFLDKAKAAANDLAAKADGALSNAGLGGPGAPSGAADRLFTDLGRAVFAESKGAGDASERERLLGELHRLEQSGQLAGGGAGPSYGAPPPPPGFNAQPSAPPAPGGGYGSAPPSAPPAPPSGDSGPGQAWAPSAPPPPPPPPSGL